MYRTVLAVIGMMMLTGCSELQIIGKATVRELGAESVVSVESERYKARKAPARVRETGVLVAAASAPTTNVAKSQRKELWRNN